MNLPVMPPVAPMLAKLSSQIPAGGEMLFEPKWDGFRCIVFRDGDEVELGSRNEKPLTRYFPDVVAAVLSELPPRCVVDGEIVVAGAKGLDFDALQMRIHPAESRVKRLAAEVPASFVAFDLLALGDRDLRPLPFSERRALLVEALSSVRPPVHLTPATDDRATAEDWFERFEGAGLDGVVAKHVGVPYLEDQRAMVKVKHERTADCVVAGFRWHKSGGVVGSLLLGLYDDAGVLHNAGAAAAFTGARRKDLVAELEPYRVGPEAGEHPWMGGEPGGRRPGAPSRWNAGKDRSFELLRPELVCEVAYDHLQGDRFRHVAAFRRWRPDRRPESCTYTQLEVAVPEALAQVFGDDLRSG
ncbi:MAG TPA: ATP-dependent DNA ligase [Acidimicrobiales bacterium]|nr:ATP-dependent DNA ligase [Acidimicrobiales bacterium]